MSDLSHFSNTLINEFIRNLRKSRPAHQNMRLIDKCDPNNGKLICSLYREKKTCMIAVM